MSDAKFDITNRIRTWSIGQEVSAQDVATQTNGVARIINQIGSGIAPPEQVFPEASGVATAGLTVEVMTLFGNTPDFLICKTASDAQVNVAKPYLLRRDIWNEASRNGILYVYAGIDARTASKGGDTEDQIIVPRYAVGDEIIVLRGLPVGGFTALDLNVDAREWARKAPE